MRPRKHAAQGCAFDVLHREESLTVAFTYIIDRNDIRVLQPGGLVLCINHDVKAFSARWLGERSPIVDIEHTYLYSPATMSRIFSAHGYQVRGAGPVYNRYSLHYLFRLLPLPPTLKRNGLGWLERSRVGRWRASVPLGNLYFVGQKPGPSDRAGRESQAGIR